MGGRTGRKDVDQELVFNRPDPTLHGFPLLRVPGVEEHPSLVTTSEKNKVTEGISSTSFTKSNKTRTPIQTNTWNL